MVVRIIPHIRKEDDGYVAYASEYGTVGRGKTIERALIELKIATKKLLLDFGIDTDVEIETVVYEFL